jgi:hypothetical protein
VGDVQLVPKIEPRRFGCRTVLRGLIRNDWLVQMKALEICNSNSNAPRLGLTSGSVVVFAVAMFVEEGKESRRTTNFYGCRRCILPGGVLRLNSGGLLCR